MIVSGGNALNFPVQALAESTPVLTNGYFYNQNGLELANRYATYAALYRAQPSIATLVDKVANSAARLSVKVWDMTDGGGRVQDTTSPYAKLMANPCPFMDVFSFWQWTVSTFEIYGEAFWYKLRNDNGETINLIPMHPSKTAVKRDENGKTWYIFSLGVASAGILTAPEEDVVVFRRYNPDNVMRGLSRLEALRSTLVNEDAARRANESWWNRGARPSLIVKHDKKLSQEAADRLKGSFSQRHGGANNAGGVVVLEEGMDAVVVQLSAEEMQYIQSRTFNREEVCMVFDVPPPVVHILDHATYSNITEQMRSMYRDSMQPRLEAYESVMDFYIRSEFFKPGERVAKFAIEDVLRGSPEQRSTSAKDLVVNGIMTPSEARVWFDLPDLGGNSGQLFANAALQPLGQVPTKVAISDVADSAAALDQATESVDPNDSKDFYVGGMIPNPSKKKAGDKPLTVRSVMGALAGTKGNKKDMREALVKQHAEALKTFFGKQADAVKESQGKKDAKTPDLNSKEWNDELSGILATLSTATTNSLGSATADKLGGTYDPDRLSDYIKTEADTSAANINLTTQDAITAILADSDPEGDEANDEDDEADHDESVDPLDGYFVDQDGRADQIATSRVASMGGLASQVGAEQSGAATKTWVVMSPNPRPSHAEMDGEEVGLNEQFSNGMNGPGDFNGGGDEVAGCTCDLEFSMPSSNDDSDSE